MSDTDQESPEVLTIIKCTNKLVIALKDDTYIVDYLRCKEFIPDSFEILDPKFRLTSKERSRMLVDKIKDKVDLRSANYYVFLEGLKSKEGYYKDILMILDEELQKQQQSKIQKDAAQQFRRGSWEIEQREHLPVRERFYSESSVHGSKPAEPVLPYPEPPSWVSSGVTSRKRHPSGSLSESVKHPRTESMSSVSSSDTETDHPRGRIPLLARLPECTKENVQRVVRAVHPNNLGILQLQLIDSPYASVLISIINDNDDYYFTKHDCTVLYWFKTDKKPSWEKLHQALKSCNEINLAYKLEHGDITFENPDVVEIDSVRHTSVKDSYGSYGKEFIPSPKSEKGRAIVSKSLEDLERGFKDLEFDIGDLLLKRKKFEDFIESASRYFSPEIGIGICSNIHDFFQKAQMCDKLSMWHYDDLEATLEKTFGKRDETVAKLLNKYEEKLANYLTSTKIVDFLKSKGKEKILSRLRRRKEFDIHAKQGYNRLGMKIETTIKEQSLEYFLDLWLSLQKHFHLTKATVLLEDIRNACMDVTWIVPDQVAATLKEEAVKAKDYFSSEQVRLLWINGEYAYNEDIHAKENEIKAHFALAQACENGRAMEVQAILHAPTVDITLPRSIDGRTPLMLASQNGHVEIVENLLKQSAIQKKVDEAEQTLGWSALFFAVKMGHKDVAEKLLENRANILRTDKNGSTVLDIVQTSSTFYQYLHEVSKTHLQFLKACEDGDLDQVQSLLSIETTNVDTIRSDGKTPTMLAAQSGSVEIIKYLLQKEPNVLITDHHGAIAIDLAMDFPNAIECLSEETMMAAAAQGKVEVIKKLLDLKIDPNIKESDEYEYTALLWACQKGHIEVLKLLLQNGADPKAESKTHWTGLHLACRYKHYDIAKILLEEKVDIVNNQTKDGWSALMLIAADGNSEIAELLLEEYKADPELEDEKGFVPLIQAAQDGHFEIVKLLVEKYPEVHVDEYRTKDPNDWSAVMFATKNGHTEIVEYLSEKGANLHRQKEDDVSVLHIAAYHGHIDLVRIFCLNEKLNVNAQDEDGITPLMYAARTGKLDVIKLLCQKLADINITENALDWTAPFFAMQAKNQRTLEFLLKYKIDLDHRDSMGNSLLDLSLIFNRRAYRSVKALATKAATKYPKKEPVKAREYKYVDSASNNWAKMMESRFNVANIIADSRKLICT